MERFKTDTQTDLRYELQGDYYLIAGEDEWLKRNRRVTYTNLLTTGRLYDYLLNIDTQANEQFELLIRQMAKAEGVTEQMKAEKQMEWVRRMNSIKIRAEEILCRELICC